MTGDMPSLLLILIVLAMLRLAPGAR